MTAQDVAVAEEICDEAFHQLDLRWLPRSGPEPQRRTPEHSASWMDDLDRDLRGGPHGADHVSLASCARLVVAADRSGYAFTTPAPVQLLAARDAPAASTLLWECLAGMTEAAEVAHVTAANPWAIDVGQSAGLSLTTRGHLALRGMEPPAPYVHNGALL